MNKNSILEARLLLNIVKEDKTEYVEQVKLILNNKYKDECEMLSILTDEIKKHIHIERDTACNVINVGIDKKSMEESIKKIAFECINNSRKNIR